MQFPKNERRQLHDKQYTHKMRTNINQRYYYYRKSWFNINYLSEDDFII